VGPKILRNGKNSWQHTCFLVGHKGKNPSSLWTYVMWLHVVSWVYLYVACTCCSHVFALSLFFIQPLYLSSLHFHFFCATKQHYASFCFYKVYLLWCLSSALQIQGFCKCTFEYKIFILICILAQGFLVNKNFINIINPRGMPTPYTM